MLKSEGITISGTVIAAALLSSCAGFQPQPDAASAYRERAETETQGSIRVRVSALSAEESRLMFDADLYGKGIQPVWIEVENTGTERVWYLPVGTDEEYFVPNEVAWIFRGGRSNAARAEMEAWLRDSAMSRLVPPGETVSGFVFTHLTSGTKGINVDLVGDDIDLNAFTFYIDVPDLRADHRDIDPLTLYTGNEARSASTLAELSREIAELPCCSEEPDRDDVPDFLLNLVVIGDIETFHHALIRGRWEEAPIGQFAGSGSGEDFDKYIGARPVPPMYVFGRIQDAVFHKTRPSVGESNQLNLWLSPVRFNGTPVWVGQTARTLSSRRTSQQYALTEPHLDEARFYFIQNLLYSGSVNSYGFLPGGKEITFEEYEAATDGTEYFTDGRRLVIWLSDEPVAYNEVGYIDWED